MPSELRLDFYDDGGDLLHRTRTPLAKYASSMEDGAVKVAKDDRGRFPDQEFGLLATKAGKVVGRYYPLSDLANALISFFYFLQTGSALPTKVRDSIEAKIFAVLSKFGLKIPADESAIEKTASMEIPDRNDPPVRVPSGTVEVRGQPVPFYGQDGLEKLASDLGREAARMKPSDRRMVALQLRSLGAKLNDTLEKYAALDENPWRESLIDKRERLIRARGRVDAVPSLRRIAAIEDLEKQAALLDALDREVRVTGIPDAYLTVFSDRPAAAERRYSEETMEKVARIMGGGVRHAMKTGKVDELDPERRRVLDEILKEEGTSCR